MPKLGRFDLGGQRVLIRKESVDGETNSALRHCDGEVAFFFCWAGRFERGLRFEKSRAFRIDSTFSGDIHSLPALFQCTAI